MKIAMVSEDTGAEVAELSAALTGRGHQVIVYTRRDDPGPPDRVLTAEGYTVVQVPAGPAAWLPEAQVLSHTGTFARFLDAEWSVDRPDVAHGQFRMSGIAAQLAARHLNLPVVQTFHALGAGRGREGAQDSSPRDRRHLETVAARTAAWVTAACTDQLVQLVRLGRSRDRISVVPFGVDLDLFSPDGPVAPRSDTHRIVSIGGFVPRAGFDVIVRALPHIPSSELVIIGGPEGTGRESDSEVRRLIRLTTELSVADRVRLHGSVARDDLPAVLRSADLVVCPPWFDTCGLAAMACGVPVVASSVGAMLDTVVHDVTGHLINPTAPAEVAKAVNRLLRDDFLRQSMGAAARDRARARYSWDRIAADTERIYDRLIPVVAPA